jgi:hypothetical protein
VLPDSDSDDEDDPEQALLTSGKEPNNYTQAMGSPDSAFWDQALHEEYHSLLENVPLPSGKKSI